ncbi:MAG: efflux transporter outer membrane subunit [Planctomycetota bacterium]|nr:efflux transporter outer membrane subunit [Planctomycetota bacterium]
MRRTNAIGSGCAAMWVAMALVGCAVGPDYKPAKPALPPGWTGQAPAPASRPASRPAGETGDLVRWWKAFNDPALTKLIERAFAANLDLKAAEARIRQARAVRVGAGSALWPAADASGSYSRGRPAGANALTSNLYRTGLDAAWEIDVFGGVRRGIEAADADVQASLEDRRAVMVTLAGEVALAYIDLRVAQQRVAVARKNLLAQQHSAEVTALKLAGGLVGELDVANADAQVATTASTIPTLEALVQQTIYTLSILLAQPPGAMVGELSSAGAVPAPSPAVPVGVPSDLLRRRPDIRKAEAAVHGATARIGVATAEMFPKFSISGSIGYSSNLFDTWTHWANRFWSWGPSATWRVFDAGAIQADIDAKKALQEQSVVAYQQTVLTALQDVENALVAASKEQERRTMIETAVAANAKAVAISTRLYQLGGQTDFIRVLDAQRGLLSAEDALVQNGGAIATDLVALYKALGGGWADEPAPPVVALAPKPAAKAPAKAK